LQQGGRIIQAIDSKIIAAKDLKTGAREEWHLTQASGPGNHYGFNLIKTEIMATESTEEHGKINAL
jgi:hypothetical protein